ncbi:MAG: DNA repair protein RecN [Dehalococcoidia bacterium]
MLVELSVHNFAVIEETRLGLGDGFNVVTGETGAGKSLLVDALEFVLGGAADRDLIRAGAGTAAVEAVFSLDTAATTLATTLAELGVDLDEEQTLVLARETHREGRTVSRLNGRAVPASVVREVGRLLVNIHGQGSHVALLDPRFQSALLDAFGGLDARREAVTAAVSTLRAMESELSALVTGARQAEQQRDLLAFQAAEIEMAALSPGEEAALVQERDLLANAETIRGAAAAAHESLYAGDTNASDLIAQALQELRKAPDPTGTLRTHIDALEATAAQVEEAARDIRAYADSIEGDPRRLAQIEDRIETVRKLKRKYGDTEEAVVAFGEDARRQLDSLDHGTERRTELETRMAESYADVGGLAWELSSARQRTAESLATVVGDELAAVGLGRVRFVAEVTQEMAADGVIVPGGGRYAFTDEGIDRVEFEVETNPGEGFKPLARVASGGETSRLMLAIKGALREKSDVPTLVFDEIDSGIGGRAADVVGQKLWRLAREGQVLCVTHLPQIAAYADRHFKVDKAVSEQRTFAGARPLEPVDRTKEIAEMLGGSPTEQLDEVARQMLEAATNGKRRAVSG